MVHFSGRDFNGYNVKLQNEFLNADAKKVFANTRATNNDGALTSNVNLNPWVVSLGVGRKF